MVCPTGRSLTGFDLWLAPPLAILAALHGKLVRQPCGTVGGPSADPAAAAVHDAPPARAPARPQPAPVGWRRAGPGRDQPVSAPAPLAVAAADDSCAARDG